MKGSSLGLKEPSKTVFYKSFMKRLDQGHLHPKLDVPRLTSPNREPNPSGRRALQKRSIRTTYSIAFGDLYMAAPAHVAATHELIPRAQDPVLWIRIRPYWIRIQSDHWIRIRIRNLNTDPDPDPGGQK
jgi:hypothetical protein